MKKILNSAKLPINYMNNKQVTELYEKIRPIMIIEGKHYYLRKLLDMELMYISYNWLGKDSISREVDMCSLSVLQDINTLHCPYFGNIISPTYREIVSQIPTELLDQVVAIEVIRNKETAEEYIYRLTNLDTTNSFRIAVIRLYKKND